jgi:hypothetical protein
VKGYKLQLKRALVELAAFPSQSLLDRCTYLRALVELPGSYILTADQAYTLEWIGSGRRLREVTHNRRRDLTCVEKRRGALVEHANIRGERWVFCSDLGRFYLRGVR